MRVGVIGCGAVSHYCHFPALARIPDVRVVAVADPDEAIRNRAIRTTGSIGFKSAEFLLANTEVDAVIIATPPATHADLGVMAARAGKLIYLEKPIATGIPDAMRLSREVEDAGIRAAVGFNRQSHPLFKRMRAMLADGAIGTVRAAQTTFCEPVPRDGMPRWKVARSNGGGVLLDLASHHIDAIRWIIGEEIISVRCDVKSDESEHDSASVSMTLTSGSIVQSFYSFRSGYAERITVFGDAGMLELDRHRGSLTLTRSRRAGYGSRRSLMVPHLRDMPWKLRRLVRPAHDPSYHLALGAFARNDSSLPSLADGEASLRVVVAAEESATQGRAIDVTYA
ncbi:MAG TPA: Gfo/Idh/MocA family oxidoreductase [Gemmatimonadaceae bacterium]